MDRLAHGHPPAPRGGAGGECRDPRLSGGAQGARRRRRGADGAEHDHRHDDDAGLRHLSLRGVRDPGDVGGRPRGGLRPERRLPGLRLWPGGGAWPDAGGSPARSGGLHRDHEPHHQLERPQHLLPLRRRRGRGGAHVLGQARPGLPPVGGRRHGRAGHPPRGRRAHRGDGPPGAGRPEDGWARGLQLRRAQLLRHHRPDAGALRLDGEGRLLGRPPPGQHAHHRRGGEADRRTEGKVLREHRPLRQHLQPAPPSRSRWTR